MAKKVLVVDDNVLFAQGLSDILTEKGYEAVAVNSGKEALERIERTIFNTILVDIKMPIMNGTETYKAIKKARPKAAVIMMTAFHVEDLSEEVGTRRILHKPLNIEEVIENIEAAKESGALVMVVDDDPNARQTLKDILEEKGYSVTLAETGSQAINVAHERLYDVLFMDVKLPTLNGLETYLAIRRHNPDIAVVMMTGYSKETKDLVELSLKGGACTCLYKPFDPKKAIDAVEKVVAG